MAHKKFIENPLGVRLSKKESLLIPLQEQEERISACFLSDLYGPRNKGYGGKDTSLPSRGLAPGHLWGCHPGCFWVALFLRLAAKETWMIALRLHYPEASVVMQSPGSERPAKGKKANIVNFSPSDAYLFSTLKSASLSGCLTSAGRLFGLLESLRP